MALPPEVYSALVTVYGQWARTSDGVGYSGHMTFTASPTTLKDTTSEIVFVPDVENINFDTATDGMWSVDLIPTNLGVLNPTNWTWNASVTFTGPGTVPPRSPEAFNFPVPVGSAPIPLTSILTDAAPSGGTYVLLPGGPVVVSPDADNVLEQRNNGLFVPGGNRIMAINSTAPDTTNWEVNSFWYDTSNES